MFKKLVLIALIASSSINACPPSMTWYFASLVATYGYEVAKTLIVAAVKATIPMPMPTK